MAIAAPNPPAILARKENIGGSQTPALVVLHATVSSDNPGTARNIAGWWKRDITKSSAHYIRDAGETVQAVYDHTVAFHCGYNQDSIGYEFCDEQKGPASRWTDADSTKILKGAARDVARLHLAYGIPIRRLSNKQLKTWADNGRKAKDGGMVSHAQMSEVFKRSTHVDPLDFPWTKFVGLVKAEAKALKAGDKIVKPTQKLYVHSVLWNANVTNNEKKARQTVFDLAEKYRPMTMMLQEIDWAVQHPEYVGWRGPADKDDSTVLLVRKDLPVLDHGIHHMTETYTGPHGYKKKPRTFPWARISVHGVPVRVASIHMPAVKKTNPAWTEADERLTKEMQGTNPIAYGGDWNGTGKSLPGKQYGDTIDHFRLVNCSGATKENLGKFGSDHWAKRMSVRVR